MKLKTFRQKNGFEFVFEFENGERKEADIEQLVSKYLQPNELKSAKLNGEWGCLEFKDGAVDIEPRTLYKYCSTYNQPKGA